MSRLDHGVLNTPLSSRGNIDAQIDRYMAKHAQERRAMVQEALARARAQKARIKAMLDAIPDERIMQLAKGINCRKPATARSAILRSASGRLDLVENVLWREFRNCGCCASWRDGQCWSPERLDSPDAVVSAGVTYSRDTCEAWCPATDAAREVVVRLSGASQ